MRIIKCLSCLLLIVLMSSCSHDAEKYAIKGIDVSHYQRTINWERLLEENELYFVFIKATEGGNYQDSIFQKNWKNAKKAGLKRGAYHFFRPQASVEWQIKNFTKQVRLEKGDLPPVLDIEDVKQVTMPQLIDRVGKWLMFVEEYYGIRPIIYASLDLYERHLKAAFPEHLVWIARYNRTEPPANTLWKFWQYNDQNRIAGIRSRIDQNVFVGTLQELNALCL